MGDLDHLSRADRRPLNVVVSGTSFWNPGDDLVRAGVLAVVRRFVAPRPINPLFYDFAPDRVPGPHQPHLGNTIAAGDLETLAPMIDLVVIAGLSAGEEIEPLYRWLIDAGLTDRTWMIGAGYENDYVRHHCSLEPEATVFRDARLIVGRTDRRPDFLRDLGTPYEHLPCPSVLGIPTVRTPANRPDGRRRVACSIQRPAELGLVNHVCAAVHARTCEALVERLAGEHEVMIVAHHKSEFAAQHARWSGTGIPVRGSSFHEDLQALYRTCDVVVSTRLHAALAAVAHGARGVVVNGTDRHTHALDGIPGVQWATDPDRAAELVRAALAADPRETADELADFKNELMDRYLGVLARHGGLAPPEVHQVDERPAPIEPSLAHG